MTLSEIRARLSQLREWAMRFANGETPEGAPVVGEIRTEMIRLEGELRVAEAAAEAPPSDPDPVPADPDEPPAVDELDEVIGRASMTRYLEAVTSGRPLEGAEAELSAATGCDRSPLPGVVVPWQMFEPNADDAYLGSDDFADAATTVQAIDAPFRERWIPRIFARQDLSYLGVRMPAMSVGDSAYYRLTSSMEPSKPAVGVAVDSEAAAVTLKQYKPRRYAARYTFYIEDLVRFAQYESSLRSDLRNLMVSGLDSEILTRIVAGLAVGDFTALGAAALTEANLRTFMVACVDAFQRCYRFEDVRVLMGLKTYQGVAAILAGDSSRYVLSDYASRIRATTRFPALSANASKGEWAIAIGTTPPIPAYEVPVWQGVSFIRDHVTQAASGIVALTATMLYQFVPIETGGMVYAQLRHTA